MLRTSDVERFSDEKTIENSFEESSSNILQSRELVAYALSCATSDEIGVAEVLHVINVSALK